MNLVMWLLLNAIVHVLVESHSIRCNNFTKQSDIQTQATAVESFDFTWSEIECDNEVHEMHIMFSLMCDSARIVDVDGQ